jgi:hypothetical protein
MIWITPTHGTAGTVVFSTFVVVVVVVDNDFANGTSR